MYFPFGEVAEIDEDFCQSNKGKREHSVWSECESLANSVEIGKPGRHVGSRAILACGEHRRVEVEVVRDIGD